MYQSHYRLHSRPFASAPNPEHYYPGLSVEKARESLVMSVERSSGAAMVVGAVGVGKTLLCQLVANQFSEEMPVCMLHGARLCNRETMLQAILHQLGLPFRNQSEGELRFTLTDHVTGQTCPRGVLLIVDEADRLKMELLEELRVITNLVKNGQPRIRLVMAGDPRLEERVGHPRMESLNQRVVCRLYLENFSLEETCDYIRARVTACGGNADDVFTSDGMETVYRATGGVPRLINQVCDHALILGAVSGNDLLDKHSIEEAWADLQQLPMPEGRLTSTNRSSDAATSEADDIVEIGSLDEELTHQPVAHHHTPHIHVGDDDIIRSGGLAPEEQLQQIERTIDSLNDIDDAQVEIYIEDGQDEVAEDEVAEGESFELHLNEQEDEEVVEISGEQAEVTLTEMAIDAAEDYAVTTETTFGDVVSFESPEQDDAEVVIEIAEHEVEGEATVGQSEFEASEVNDVIEVNDIAEGLESQSEPEPIEHPGSETEDAALALHTVDTGITEFMSEDGHYEHTSTLDEHEHEVEHEATQDEQSEEIAAEQADGFGLTMEQATNPFDEQFDDEEIVIQQFASPSLVANREAGGVTSAYSRGLARRLVAAHPGLRMHCEDESADDGAQRTVFRPLSSFWTDNGSQEPDDEVTEAVATTDDDETPDDAEQESISADNENINDDAEIIIQFHQNQFDPITDPVFPEPVSAAYIPEVAMTAGGQVVCATADPSTQEIAFPIVDGDGGTAVQVAAEPLVEQQDEPTNAKAPSKKLFRRLFSSIRREA